MYIIVLSLDQNLAAISYKNVFFSPRTVQLTVSNALVGRIIGQGGMKINSIQVEKITVKPCLADTPEMATMIVQTPRTVRNAIPCFD